MAIRKFCDLCDSALDDRSWYFSIAGARVDNGDKGSYRDDKILMSSPGSSDYVETDFSHSMVCKLCYVKLLKLIRELTASRV